MVHINAIEPVSCGAIAGNAFDSISSTKVHYRRVRTPAAAAPAPAAHRPPAPFRVLAFVDGSLSLPEVMRITAGTMTATARGSTVPLPIDGAESADFSQV